MTSRSSVRGVVELELLPPSRSDGEDIAAAGSLACGRGRGAGNGNQMFTASMLTALRLICRQGCINRLQRAMM